MGLIRIGGGSSGAGLQHYLETGEKLGREHTRDELDKRIVLEGDLDETARIIDGMHMATPEAERFIHLTFAFKEDNISPEMYAAINADIKDFLLGAYEPGEMTYYAEVHDPKIKTEVDRAGDVQERKPHIHVIIPKFNNLTGRKEDPLGMLSAKFGGKQTTESMIDAFQEHINHKYGLASPKDAESRRVDFTSKADILSRIDGHDFKGKNREWQQTIRDRMISEKVETPEAFKAMLESIGEVSIGKEGQPGQHWQVRPRGEQKNVRLKDWQFSNEFIAKQTADKEAFVHQERVKRYLETNPGKPTPDKIQEVLGAWEMRKNEIRFIHTGSKLFRETYKNATTAEKLAILAGQKEKFYAKAKREFGFEDSHSQPTLEESNAAALAAEFPNRRLNASHMRSMEEVREAITKGEAIIASPEKALEEMTFLQSTINDRDLERYLLKHTADQEQFDDAMAAILAAPGLVVRQDEQGNTTFTTENVVAIEKSLVATVERMAKVGQPPASSDKPSEPETDFEKVAREVASTKSMNEGQAAAYKQLVGSQQIGIVNGAAGTGKSYILAAMRETYEKTGHTVYGAILQGKTAEDLERDSGIKSSTMHSFLSRLDKGTLKLDSKAVVVVDEAGMIGSRQMESILRHVENAGAKIRLVGDVKQLASVEYGRAFKEVSERVEVASLTQIMRQKEEWQRTASEQLSRHEIAEPLKAYAENGNVLFSENAAAAQTAIVEKWADYRAADPAQSLVVLVHTNKERQTLNGLMREEIKKGGGLPGEIDVNTAEGILKMAVGESVMFTKGDRELGVKNGTSGTIECIKGDSITVKLDNGKTATLSAKNQIEPNSITYGYASTVHKSQGMTKDRAIILANASMSLENTYVAMSRHKTSLDIVADKSVFNDLDGLIAKLDKTGRKDFSHDASQKEWESARKNDSVLAQYQADFAHDKVIERAAKAAGFIEMRDNLDARQLLDRVAKTHGVDIDKYGIVKNANGLDRIQCGKRLLNVSDFLTKEMHFDYKTEAAPAMRETYAAQLEAVYAPQREPGKAITLPMPAHEVSKPLWRDFQAYRAERAAEYKAAAEALTKELSTRKAVLAHDAQVKKSHVQNSVETFAAKRTEIKEIRAESAEAVKVLSKEISDRRGELMNTYKKQPAAEYKDFLAAGAVVSDKHLSELLRVSLSKTDQERTRQIEKVRKAVAPSNQSARSAEALAVTAAREVREALHAAELRAAEAKRLAELSALRLKEQAEKAAADKAAAAKKAESEKTAVLAKSAELERLKPAAQLAAAAEGQLKNNASNVMAKGRGKEKRANKIPDHVKAERQKKGGLGLG